MSNLPVRYFHVKLKLRDVQEVQLDKHIKLLDSPGVIMSNTGDQASLILRNCIRLEDLTDPLPPIEAILRRCNKAQVSFCIMRNSWNFTFH